jgi:enoyl-CoA hydratase/carnithine racemase
MSAKLLESSDSSKEEEAADAVAAVGNLAQDVAYLWRRLPVPVIAVLQGMCFGGGTSFLNCNFFRVLFSSFTNVKYVVCSHVLTIILFPIQYQGMQIALGADMRFSTKDCRLSIMEAKWGLIPDMSGSITLRELGLFQKLR